ncbi:putative integral to membrane protein [Kockovaella imperatae]|uniref:Putative integral to membrane protein n=1 Tax=Kockovaella imperatae TaxID=4999 RepID=A0A1Y1UG44_9TREE|nr:putative integral to membrane protein [Kockovaella imperatae]ORX36045.1 putative integral to membrane protein [Kockovaella imperatae]
MRHSVILFLAAGLAVTLAQQQDCPSDPYVDPSQDTCNPLRYVPSIPLNAVAAALYFTVAIILTFLNYKWRANYMLCLVIGAYCEGLGLALRLALRNNLHSSGLYIVMYLFVVLSPCAFLAGDYILLGRLVQHLDGTQYLRPFKARLISRIFIISDVITFLIQAAGGGLSTANKPSVAETGGHIFLAGIAAQMGSFILFSFIWAMFAFRVRFQDQDLWQRKGWKSLHWALGFTCICFMIRSVFRTVELSEGYIGYLATHERFFLGLDTLPLFLGISTYVFFWPGKYITPETRINPGPSDPAISHGESGHSDHVTPHTTTETLAAPPMGEKASALA